MDEVRAAGAQLVACSTDSVYALRVFSAALGGLPFPILGDRSHQVSRAYGVLDEASGNARRSVFVIERSGTISFANLSFAGASAAHYEEVVAHLRSLSH